MNLHALWRFGLDDLQYWFLKGSKNRSHEPFHFLLLLSFEYPPYNKYHTFFCPITKSLLDLGWATRLRSSFHLPADG
jgi:hypothetical protein